MSDPFALAVERIVKAQEGIIGPLAVERAKMVPGLEFDAGRQTAALSGDKAHVLELLIEQYQQLFGGASVEVCRSAIRDLLPQIPAAQVPNLLR